ncbi:MAG TPA: pantoate--beta-alanine ligase [Bryobacteraceae bacterium]|jgi:pantoate--beta-alanine ligase
MAIEVIHTIAELRARLASERARLASKKDVGLVPTMGALHQGHGSLIDRAAAENACTVVSIFVNPIQFNDPADYQRYPRTLATDADFCERHGARIIFAPSTEEMYPEPPKTFVEVEGVGEHLCGKFRPGHFRGVATVVMKLFQIVQPERAYFGEKDAQQLAVIERMVFDLSVPVKVIPVATVREADGLAMSSRNQHLTGEQRAVAPLLYRALQEARRSIQAGERDRDRVKESALAILSESAIRVEYLEIVDASTMQPVERIAGRLRIAMAAWVGSTRLIDNVFVAVG